MFEKLRQWYVKRRLRFDISNVKRPKTAIDAPRFNKLAIIYRICDAGYPKEKQPYINNENCLKNAVANFPLAQCQWHVLADNVSENTYQMILKYIPESCVERISVGHGAGTFRLGYEKALQYDDDVLIYFLEDDYLHNNNAMKILKEAYMLNEAEYITLYDHPDKYGHNSENPFVVGGEKTKLFLTESAHWKITNSTTMTFAASVKILREDKCVFWEWTTQQHPHDFEIFYQLTKFKKRRLISSVPGYSTHGDIGNLSPLIDWAKIGNTL